MPEKEQWYSNKELFEQITGMKDEFRDLRADMKETRTMIKQYNGLREEIGKTNKEIVNTKKEIQVVKDKVEDFESRGKGKKAVFDGIVKYGGWIVAILAMISGYLKVFL